MTQTNTPNTIQASRQPLAAITAEAMRGNATRPMVWDEKRIPLARPLIRTNQRETTTDVLIWTGLEKMTRLTP